jgi:predicted nuclease of predicted toxin-antitoxin system
VKLRHGLACAEQADDENVPNSVAEFFVERGHNVPFVRDLFPAGTPDPVIATIGNQLSAIVVTWDRDFEQLVRRIPEGNRARFRRLGRISFRCNERTRPGAARAVDRNVVATNAARRRVHLTSWQSCGSS